jgi:hypothetical protein
MNYHEWSKTASPYANALSPQITCSTCIDCKQDYQRDDTMMFNPLYCPQNIGHLDQNNGAYIDSPYGRLVGSLSQWLFG